MDRGTIDLPDLLAQLEGRSLHYRLALLKDGQEWKTHTLMIVDLPLDDSGVPSTFAYDYELARFHGGPIDDQMVGKWLAERVGELSSSEDSEQPLRFSLHPFTGLASWQRFPSCYEVDWQESPLPTMRYEVTGVPNGHFPQPSAGFLLSDKAPFFPNFRAALRKLVYQLDTSDADTNSDTPSATVIVKLAESEAFLRQMDITPTAIRVTVAGDGVAGARLIISDGAELNFDRILTDAQTEELPLPEGVPSAFYIVLSRRGRWLDYYHRDERWPFTRSDRENVTVERPSASPQIELEATVSQGEGLRIEFKRELGADRSRFLSTVSAFANTAGGTILIGVDDDGSVRGVAGDANNVRDDIMCIIHGNIMPMPNVEAHVVEFQGETIIMVTVDANLSDPCGVVVHDAPRYFIRRSATNFHAQPSQISDLVLLRHPTPTERDPFFGYRQS